MVSNCVQCQLAVPFTCGHARCIPVSFEFSGLQFPNDLPSVRLLMVSSNMIDGLWTPFKEFMFKHRGVHRSKYPNLASEYEWRHNGQGTDLYKDLLRIWATQAKQHLDST